MSLKTVHIVFISVSVLLAIWFGGWAIQQYVAGDGVSVLIMGIVSLALAVVLIVYGKRFLQKLKHVGFM